MLRVPLITFCPIRIYQARPIISYLYWAPTQKWDLNSILWQRWTDDTMASGKGISRAFSIDSILSNGKEKLLQCQTESSFLQRDSGLPPMATRGLPLFTDTDFGFKAAQARCNVPQRYPTVGSAHVPLLGYESQQQQQQQAPFATRYLSPPGSLLSPSWKPDLDAIYQNVYLETLLQGKSAAISLDVSC